MKKLILILFMLIAMFAVDSQAQIYQYQASTWRNITTPDTLTGTSTYLPSSSGFRMYQTGRYWFNFLLSIDFTVLSDSADVIIEWSDTGTSTDFTPIAQYSESIPNANIWHDIDITGHYLGYIRIKLEHTASDAIKYSYMLYNTGNQQIN